MGCQSHRGRTGSLLGVDLVLLLVIVGGVVFC